MEINDYISKSERTAKKFEKLELSLLQVHVLKTLLSRIATQCEALDELKKGIIYGKEQDLAEFCTAYRIEHDYVAEESGKTLSSTATDMLHGVMGMAGEAGEIIEATLNPILHNAELDGKNLIEEMGDSMWYQALILRTLNVPGSVMLDINYDKLMARYEEGYSDKDALNRDAAKESEAMEQTNGST